MKWFDPVYLLGEEGYSSIATFIVQSLFDGTFARVISAALLIIGVWFVFRKKQTAAGMGFIALSSLIIFGKSILNSII